MLLPCGVTLSGGSARPGIGLTLARRGDHGRVHRRHQSPVRRPRRTPCAGRPPSGGADSSPPPESPSSPWVYSPSTVASSSPGSPLAASRIVEAFSGTATADPTATTVSDGHQQVVVTATENGYSPHLTQIRAGIPTTLVVRSQGAVGCVRGFVIGGSQTILPESGDTSIDLGTPKPGTLHYACAMGMYTGTITVT